MKIINLLIGNYKVREFFDSDIYNGIEVFKENGERIGSIFGLSIPENKGSEEFKQFEKEIENWVLENEYI